MQDDQYEAAADRWEECGRAVDGAGEHRRQDEPQDGIERRVLRQKSTVSAAHNDERRHEDDHASKADLLFELSCSTNRDLRAKARLAEHRHPPCCTIRA